MKKAAIFTALICMLLLVSCSHSALTTESESTESISSSQNISSEQDNISSMSSLQENSDPTEDLSEENGTGGFYPDGSIDERYTAIDIRLSRYVGSEIYTAWKESGAEFNVHSFIEFTQIPQSTFTSIMRPEYPEETLTNFREIFGEELTLSELQDMLGFSLEEIDILYSGDQAAINRAFCGPYGVFNETDGQIYGLKWLASHSAEDYVKAGLPLEQVNEVLMRVTEEYPQGSGFFELAQKTEETLTSAIALEAELAADADTEKPNSEQEDVSADDENVAE